jgi:predicted flavoprotein YhiN
LRARGLNLTHSEPLDRFMQRYGEREPQLALAAGLWPDQVRAWAQGLGIETFVGTSGRVFPWT